MDQIRKKFEHIRPNIEMANLRFHEDSDSDLSLASADFPSPRKDPPPEKGGGDGGAMPPPPPRGDPSPRKDPPPEKGGGDGGAMSPPPPRDEPPPEKGGVDGNGTSAPSDAKGEHTATHEPAKAGPRGAAVDTSRAGATIVNVTREDDPHPKDLGKGSQSAPHPRREGGAAGKSTPHANQSTSPDLNDTNFSVNPTRDNEPGGEGPERANASSEPDNGDDEVEVLSHIDLDEGDDGMSVSMSQDPPEAGAEDRPDDQQPAAVPKTGTATAPTTSEPTATLRGTASEASQPIGAEDVHDMLKDAAERDQPSKADGAKKATEEAKAAASAPKTADKAQPATLQLPAAPAFRADRAATDRGRDLVTSYLAAQASQPCVTVGPNLVTNADMTAYRRELKRLTTKNTIEVQEDPNLRLGRPRESAAREAAGLATQVTGTPHGHQIGMRALEPILKIFRKGTPHILKRQLPPGQKHPDADRPPQEILMLAPVQESKVFPGNLDGAGRPAPAARGGHVLVPFHGENTGLAVEGAFSAFTPASPSIEITQAASTIHGAAAVTSFEMLQLRQLQRTDKGNVAQKGGAVTYTDRRTDRDIAAKSITAPQTGAATPATFRFTNDHGDPDARSAREVRVRHEDTGARTTTRWVAAAGAAAALTAARAPTTFGSGDPPQSPLLAKSAPADAKAAQALLTSYLGLHAGFFMEDMNSAATGRPHAFKDDLDLRTAIAAEFGLLRPTDPPLAREGGGDRVGGSRTTQQEGALASDTGRAQRSTHDAATSSKANTATASTVAEEVHDLLRIEAERDQPEKAAHAEPIADAAPKTEAAPPTATGAAQKGDALTQLRISFTEEQERDRLHREVIAKVRQTTRVWAELNLRAPGRYFATVATRSLGHRFCQGQAAEVGISLGDLHQEAPWAAIRDRLRALAQAHQEGKAQEMPELPSGAGDHLARERGETAHQLIRRRQAAERLEALRRPARPPLQSDAVHAAACITTGLLALGGNDVAVVHTETSAPARQGEVGQVRRYRAETIKELTDGTALTKPEEWDQLNDALKKSLLDAVAAELLPAPKTGTGRKAIPPPPLLIHDGSISGQPMMGATGKDLGLAAVINTVPFTWEWDGSSWRLRQGPFIGCDPRMKDGDRHGCELCNYTCGCGGPETCPFLPQLAVQGLAGTAAAMLLRSSQLRSLHRASRPASAAATADPASKTGASSGSPRTFADIASALLQKDHPQDGSGALKRIIDTLKGADAQERGGLLVTLDVIGAEVYAGGFSVLSDPCRWNRTTTIPVPFQQAQEKRDIEECPVQQLRAFLGTGTAYHHAAALDQWTESRKVGRAGEIPQLRVLMDELAEPMRIANNDFHATSKATQRAQAKVASPRRGPKRGPNPPAPGKGAGGKGANERRRRHRSASADERGRAAKRQRPAEERPASAASGVFTRFQPQPDQQRRLREVFAKAAKGRGKGHKKGGGSPKGKGKRGSPPPRKGTSKTRR